MTSEQANVINKVNVYEKTMVTAALGEIPEVGGMISAFVGLLWPDDIVSNGDPWKAIKDSAEQALHRTLATDVYNDVSQILGVMKENIDDYLIKLNDPEAPPGDKKASYNTTQKYFEENAWQFQRDNYELVLLPLFTQMANLHLALYRDGAQFGKDWGFTTVDINTNRDHLTDTISRYTTYAQDQYSSNAPVVGGDISKFFKRIDYDNYMNFSVLDSVFYWKYFDPEVPFTDENGQKPRLTREIFSHPYGDPAPSPLTFPPANRERITEIEIAGWDRVDGIRVKYGNTWTPRQGNADGGSDELPYGWKGQVEKGNPIVGVNLKTGSIVNAMQLKFQDNTLTNWCGGRVQGGDNYNLQLTEFDHIVSSITIFGVSNYYGSANSILVGFRYADSYT